MSKKIDRRNLYQRGDAICYQRIVDGKRESLSTKTNDWTEAAAVRDYWEAQASTSMIAAAASPVAGTSPRCASSRSDT